MLQQTAEAMLNQCRESLKDSMLQVSSFCLSHSAAIIIIKSAVRASCTMCGRQSVNRARKGAQHYTNHGHAVQRSVQVQRNLVPPARYMVECKLELSRTRVNSRHITHCSSSSGDSDGTVSFFDFNTVRIGLRI